MLEAKVKSSIGTRTVIAFSGQEYVKYEFRPVPRNEKCEKQAQDHPMLIVQMKGKVSSAKKGKVSSAKKRASKKEIIEKAIEEDES